MASTSTWTFLSSFNLFSAFATKPTEQSTEESIKEPLLEKQNQNANASAPIKEAPTVSENNAGTQSTTLYSRLVGMFTWSKEKEPSVKSAENLSPPPSEAGSSKRSVSFGSESSRVFDSELVIPLGEEKTKPLKQPNPETKKKSPAVVVASVNPPVNIYAKAPRAQTENEPRATIKVAEDTPTATNIAPSKIELPSNTEKSVFETFAQQFVEAKNNVQNTAGTVISEVSGQAINEASERTHSAVKGLTSFFEKNMDPPAGPSAKINHEAPTGPVDNSSKAPGSTPATGPVSSSSSSSRSSSRGLSTDSSSVSSSGSGSSWSSASEYSLLKMKDFSRQTGPRDKKERERAEGEERQESQKALRDKLDAKSQAHVADYQKERMARDLMTNEATLAKLNKGLKSADDRGGPTVHDPRHENQAEYRGVIKAGEPHNKYTWEKRVTSGGPCGHGTSR